jgi:hypothetical protein
MFTAPQHATFDWARAIERNSEALRGVVAVLFAMLGEVTVQRLPHSLHRGILRILRPAESALRRLIVIAALGLVVKPVAPRTFPTGPIKKGGLSRPVFRLFDPRKVFTDHANAATRALPRITIFGYDPRVAAIWAAQRRSNPAALSDDGLVNAQRLIRRFQALKAALDNLPRQAKRLVRARMRRENIPSLKFKSPLRPGPPPGHRRKKLHEIDEILAECHGLARDALKLDTT